MSLLTQETISYVASHFTTPPLLAIDMIKEIPANSIEELRKLPIPGFKSLDHYFTEQFGSTEMPDEWVITHYLENCQ